MIRGKETIMDESLKKLAKGLTVLCVRNTVIEDYHCKGQLSDADMKAFNKDVCNKMYAALSALLGKDKKARALLYEQVERRQPYDWDEPENKGL